MTKAKTKAKPTPPAKVAKPVISARLDYIGLTGLVANLLVLGLFAWPLLDRQKSEPSPNTPFTTFEKRIRSEEWAAGATKIRMGDFKNAREARDWAEKQWVKIGGESFEPLDKEEAIAGQDLDSLAALWERWGK